MAELVGPFLDDDGELVVNEYLFSEADFNYLKNVERAEAARTLCDIGAASILLDGLRFDILQRLIVEFDTPPFELNNGEEIKSPGRYISVGIRVAQMMQSTNSDAQIAATEAMDELGLTAQTLAR